MHLVTKKILGIVSGPGRGKKVLSRRDFDHVAPRATVNRALKQLVERGKIRRVGRGLYDFPRYGELLKKSQAVRIPAAMDAIQRRDGVLLMQDGAVAANNLGLTNMVPAKVTYLTDGSSRTIIIDHRTIVLKRIHKKWMYWHSRRGQHVVLALRWLGKRNISDFVLQKLSVLPSDVKHDLLSGLSMMPGWMADTIKKVCSDAR